MVRTRAAEISQVGRNTQGVTLMRVADGEKLIALQRVDAVVGEEVAAGHMASTDADLPLPPKA